MPVAVLGMLHSPCGPHTANVAAAFSGIGWPIVPTLVAARVSARRHGTIGGNDDGVLPAASPTLTAMIVNAPASNTPATIAGSQRGDLDVVMESLPVGPMRDHMLPYDSRDAATQSPNPRSRTVRQQPIGRRGSI